MNLVEGKGEQEVGRCDSQTVQLFIDERRNGSFGGLKFLRHLFVQAGII